MIASPVYTEPVRVAQIMAGFRYPWFVCGGWAIDLFINRVSRHHQDVDIGIWRSDQLALRAYLVACGWTPEKAIDGQRLSWPENEFIELPIHAISCKNPHAQPSRIEVLFNEARDGFFRFRRDLSITMPLEDAIVHAKAGVSILAPEIVLLYKAKDLTRKDNQRDFETVLPYLNPARRAWLQAALLRMHPGHEWLGLYPIE